ncbi:MAG: DUF402 domain-containing protein [Dehalococcoidia bacterium]
MEIVEVKRHPDGGEDRFACELVVRLPRVAVVRFVHWRGRSHGGFSIPRGSVTHGFFWPRRRYSLYRMAAPDGVPIADRYDIVEDARVSEREVSYLDLLLDIWIAPDGRVIVEDEDEVRDFAQRGLLSREQLATIDRARDLVLRRHRAIAREADELLAAARRSRL